MEVAVEGMVRKLRPDFQRLLGIPVRGVIVTSRASLKGFDFVSRFFAPAVGVDEDPATGSSHCALTPYWAAKLGKPEMLAYQASERGGVLKVRLEGKRVKIAGQAVTIFRAALRV